MPVYGKKKKGSWRGGKRSASGDEAPAAAKRSKTEGSSGDGESWPLSAKRKIGLGEFNGSIYVNIREFYEKDGQELPGKKGISLNVEQYMALVDAIPKINEVLKTRGLLPSTKEEEEEEDAAKKKTKTEEKKEEEEEEEEEEEYDDDEGEHEDKE